MFVYCFEKNPTFLFTTSYMTPQGNGHLQPQRVGKYAVAKAVAFGIALKAEYWVLKNKFETYEFMQVSITL